MASDMGLSPPVQPSQCPPAVSPLCPLPSAKSVLKLTEERPSQRAISNVGTADLGFRASHPHETLV